MKINAEEDSRVEHKGKDWRNDKQKLLCKGITRDGLDLRLRTLKRLLRGYGNFEN